MKLKAREKIKSGDIVMRLWANWCRPCKPKDTPISPLGISLNNALYGDSVDILVTRHPKTLIINDCFEII